MAFWVVFPCFYGSEKVLREVSFFFGGVDASIELRQIFDVLDFTYVGLHTSTDTKDIFLELHLHTLVFIHQLTQKIFFLELQKKKKDSFSR